VVKHISDEILIMYMGKCMERAETETLFRDPRHPYTQALLSSILRPNLKSRNIDIEALKGEVSSPIAPPPGCRFAARCPHAVSECTLTDIPFVTVADNHIVACIMEDTHQ
jgi:peptide/nickel transport system ATP-binding protein